VGRLPPGVLHTPVAPCCACRASARFDLRFMEDDAASRAVRLEPASVELVRGGGGARLHPRLLEDVRAEAPEHAQVGNRGDGACTGVSPTARHGARACTTAQHRV
jgi:hypothetical protein